MGFRPGMKTLSSLCYLNSERKLEPPGLSSQAGCFSPHHRDTQLSSGPCILPFSSCRWTEAWRFVELLDRRQHLYSHAQDCVWMSKEGRKRVCCHGDTEANYEMRVETHSTISTVIYSSNKSRHRSQNQCSMKWTKNKPHNPSNTVFYTSESSKRDAPMHI